jgi:hypothetical protein
MQPTIGGALRAHFALGYSNTIFWLDAVLLALVAADVFRYIQSGLSSTAAFMLQGLSIQPRLFLSTFSFVVFLLIVAPLFIGFLRVIGFLEARPGRGFGRRPAAVSYVHMCCVAILVYFNVVEHTMEVLSGLVKMGNAYELGYIAYFHTLVMMSPSPASLVGIGGLMASSLGAALLWFAVGKKRESLEPLRLYALRAELAHLPSELHVYAGTQDARPSVELISRAATDTLRIYRSKLAGSRIATEFIDNESAVSMKKLAESVFGSRSNDVSWCLFTGTRRAFQAALTDSPTTAIVALPYCSSSLVEFLAWHCAASRVPFFPVAFSGSDFMRQWPEQKNLILKATEIISDKEMTVVISEVNFATGLRIPLIEALAALRSSLGARLKCVIIDGTNAVGNGAGVTDAQWDHYVFSPHKWLMAPERCGVLVSRRPLANATAPGMWVPGKRKTEIQVDIVAGLKGVSETISKYGFSFFFERCRALRKEFAKSLPSKVEIIGGRLELEPTFVLSCCPAAETTWVEKESLERDVAANRLKVSLLQIDPTRPWLRVGMPYHLDLRDLTRITNFLNDRIRD